MSWLTSTTASLDTAKADSGNITAAIATEPILVYDVGLRPVGHLAESWRAVDPVTYVYKVRQGVRFWDGTPLTADDIAFAIERHLDPKLASGIAGLIPPLASVDVTAPDEVTVKLEEPNATWQYIPAQILVAPRRVFEEQGKDYGAPDQPVMGTGPFKVTKFRASDRIEYVANDAYWGRKPIARKLTINVNVSDSQTNLLAMRAGAADGTFGVSSDLLRQWRRIPALTVTSQPGPLLWWASFDVEAKPWDDVHVRRAFAHALDKKGLVNAVLRDAGQVEDSIIPRGVWGDRIPQSRLDAIYAGLRVYEFDLAKAREELAQSAYPNGLTATLWYYGSDTGGKIAATWQQNLKKIGVTLRLEIVSDQEGTDREDNHHDLGFHLNGDWAGQDYPDPIDFAVNLLPSDHARRGYFNEANYKNPIVDRLIKENLTSLDVAHRADLVARIMSIVAEDLPYVPIWTHYQSVAVADRVVYEGFTPYYDQQFWVDHLRRAA
jgi:peptide/nickel transport system substrate-binding protein